MKNSLLLFIIIGLLFISCQEQEEPEQPFGTYVAQSIVSDRALDIAGTGIPSTDLTAQFDALRNWKNSISISLYSPEYWNVGFSQITFGIPFQDDEDPKFGMGIGSFGRKVEFSEDGGLSLDWSLTPDFDEPHQLHQTIVVEHIQFGHTSAKTIELVVDQTFFDQTQDAWVEAKVTYTLRKEEN